MVWNFLKVIPKSFLGIDIGTSVVKIVELSRWGERMKLENYGELKAENFYDRPFRTFEKSILTVSTTDVARGVLAILNEAKIKTKDVCLSIPDFSSFFTWFELPPMSQEEVAEAVRYEARQYVPVPSGEVTLDWQVINGKASKKNPFKVLLVAVPNEIINQYREIAALCDLRLQSLEAEVFGLARSLAKNKGEPRLIIDIGAQSTTVSIIENKILKSTHSFDLSGNELTQVLAKALNVDPREAEQIKREFGILPNEKQTRDILLPLVDLIVDETSKISQNFYQQESKEIKNIVMAGGSSAMPGLSDYLAENLKKTIEIANPFAGIFYPPLMEETLKQIGPSYAIAVGMAMRGLE